MNKRHRVIAVQEQLTAANVLPGVGAFAMFSDPEGNTIGLMKEAPDQPGE